MLALARSRFRTAPPRHGSAGHAAWPPAPLALLAAALLLIAFPLTSLGTTRVARAAVGRPAPHGPGRTDPPVTRHALENGEEEEG